MSIQNKFINNTFWLLFGKIFRIMTNLIVVVLIARYLGPEEFGTYSYAYSLMQILSVIGGLGLDGILVRNLVNNESEKGVLVGTSLLMRFLFSLPLIALLSLIIFVLPNHEDIRIFVILIGSSIIFQSFNIIDYYFQSKVFSKYIVISNSICLLLTSIIKLILIAYGYPLIFFGIVILFEYLAIALGYIYVYYIHSKKSIDWNFDFNVGLNLIKDSWPIVFAGIGYIIYRKIDQIMIYNMLDAKDVGYYAASSKLIDTVCIIPAAITTSIFPYLIKNYNNKKIFRNNILLIYRAFALYSMIIITMIYFNDQKIVSLIYGSDYIVSHNVLFILSIGILFESMAKINGRWIILKNFQIISLYRTLFGALLNVALNIFFIPKYGIEGAAYSTLITLFLSVFVFYIFHHKTRNIFIIQLKSILTFYNVKNFKQVFVINKNNK